MVQTDGFLDQKRAALDVYAGEMEFIGTRIMPYVRSGYELFYTLRPSR